MLATNPGAIAVEHTARFGCSHNRASSFHGQLKKLHEVGGHEAVSQDFEKTAIHVDHHCLERQRPGNGISRRAQTSPPTCNFRKTYQQMSYRLTPGPSK